jgi:hypothetical protein
LRVGFPGETDTTAAPSLISFAVAIPMIIERILQMFQHQTKRLEQAAEQLRH